jgi:hypothetical protein
MSLKAGENALAARKSIKLMLNTKDLKKCNSEFLPYKKFTKKKIDYTIHKEDKLSVLDNKKFFEIIKVDPRLDK